MSGPARTYLLDLSRENLLDWLDKDRTFVEIGVAEGAFSQEILKRCRPSCLTLIDLWAHQEDPSYVPDVNNVPSQEQDARYQAVKDRFSGPNVSILRQDSLSAARCFADGSLDYIYIDAMHTFEAVTADLEAWWPKLADGGLLMGHDYANHIVALKSGFGVVEAVNKFVERTGCAFVGITRENYPYPSYILARSWHQKALEIHDRADILGSFETGRMSWELMPLPDGSIKIFPKF
ncbi:MAG: class I SAM-dependent methyltransferase [Alphaproteobacteria bacterium]|nr:class I SAM-dependent methyltransferase [Alphaproteobacteria bacterium]